jgi:hypothetical protein
VGKIVLQKCKIRAETLVVDRKQLLETMEWAAFQEKFAPDLGRESLLKLQNVRLGAFVGLSQVRDNVVNFILINPDLSGDISWILKKDPSFEGRIVEVYRVELVEWDGVIAESI